MQPEGIYMMRTVSEFIDHIENCGLRIAFQLEKFLHPQRPDFGEDDVSLIEAVVDQRKTPVVNIMASQNVRHAIILADYDFKSDAFILKDSEKTHSTAESHNVEDEYIIKKPLTQKVKLSDSLFYYEPHEGFYIAFTAEARNPSTLRMKRTLNETNMKAVPAGKQVKSRKVYVDQVPETWTGKRIINAQVDVKEIAIDDGDGGDQVQLDLGGLSLDDFDGVDLDRVIEDAVAMNNVPTGLITLFKEELRRKLTKNN